MTHVFCVDVLQVKKWVKEEIELFYLNSTLNFGIPIVFVFQLEVYYKADRLLTGLTAQQKGTTARWYSNKTSLSLMEFNASVWLFNCVYAKWKWWMLISLYLNCNRNFHFILHVEKRDIIAFCLQSHVLSNLGKKN